jgi:hypothetical protein
MPQITGIRMSIVSRVVATLAPHAPRQTQHITHVRIDSGEILPVSTVINMITAHQDFFWTIDPHNQRRANVVVRRADHAYIQSEPDGDIPDNLLSQPEI